MIYLLLLLSFHVKDKPYEVRPGSYIVFTNREYDTTDLDTIAYIDTNGVFHKYFRGDSAWSKKLVGFANWVVRDTAELYEALDSLQDGQTIQIRQGIYRINRWLDINKSRVSILGEGSFTADSSGVLIKPIDNANVGGFRFGTTNSIGNIYITGIGFEGNADNQDTAAHCLNAFFFDSVENASIENCYVKKPSPYRTEAGHTGGAGIKTSMNTSNLAIKENTFVDGSWRDIELAGTNIKVEGNKSFGTAERMISASSISHDTAFYASTVYVINNICYHDETNSGAVIGYGESAVGEHLGNLSAGDTCGNLIVRGNQAYGEFRRFISVVPYSPGAILDTIFCTGFTVTNNICRRTGSPDSGNDGIYFFPSCDIHGFKKIGDILIQNNVITGTCYNGIELRSTYNTTVTNNILRDYANESIYLGAYSSALVYGNSIPESRDTFNVENCARFRKHVVIDSSLTVNNLDVNGTAHITDSSRFDAPAHFMDTTHFLGGGDDSWMYNNGINLLIGGDNPVRFKNTVYSEGSIVLTTETNFQTAGQFLKLDSDLDNTYSYIIIAGDTLHYTTATGLLRWTGDFKIGKSNKLLSDVESPFIEILSPQYFGGTATVGTALFYYEPNAMNDNIFATFDLPKNKAGGDVVIDSLYVRIWIDNTAETGEADVYFQKFSGYDGETITTIATLNNLGNGVTNDWVNGEVLQGTPYAVENDAYGYRLWFDCTNTAATGAICFAYWIKIVYHLE